MGSKLLKKEEEYYKLNLELENKTKELLNEVSNVMKIQDNIPPEISLKANFLNKSYSSQYTAEKPILTTEWRAKLVEENKNIEDLTVRGVPDTVSEMGIKGITHFFKAKIKKMQEDIDKLQTECKIKYDEVKKLQKENQRLNDDKEKWFQISTSNKTHISKLESQITLLHSKLQAKEVEKNNLKKENEALQKDIKQTTTNASTLEVKLNRVNEECEKLKLTLKKAKQEDKEIKENHKKDIAEMTLIIKKIEKHRNELLVSFKKQLQLIDNLKRQKAHIETYKLGEIAECEFMKILDKTQ